MDSTPVQVEQIETSTGARPVPAGSHPALNRKGGRWRSIVAVIAALLMMGTGGFLVARNLMTRSVSEKVQDVEALQAAIANGIEQNRPIDEQVKRFQELGASMAQLSPEEREQLRSRNRPFMMTMMETRSKTYAKLPVEERQVSLDRDIDMMQGMMAMMKLGGGFGRPGGGPPGAGGPPGGGPPGVGGPPGGGGPPAGGPPGGRPPGGGPPGGGPGGGPPGGFGGSREDRIRGILDNSTPGSRAAAAQYFSDLGARMKERGINLPGPGGPR